MKLLRLLLPALLLTLAAELLAASTCAHLAADQIPILAKKSSKINAESQIGLMNFLRRADAADPQTARCIETIFSQLEVVDLEKALAQLGNIDDVDSLSGIKKLVKAKGASPLKVLTNFGDEVAERSFAVLNKVDDVSGFTDDAVRGVAVAEKAIQDAGMPLTTVKSFVEGNVVTPARAAKTFENVNKLEGVIGLEEYVDFVRRSGDNASGIDGAIYESTVARAVKEGNVPGSGGLQKIAADGAEETRKIDAVTEVWAIQAKHKADGNLTLGDVSESYLDELATQAANAQRRPVLVTNTTLSDGLAAACGTRAIHFVTIP
jgi:hypothetical protein